MRRFWRSARSLALVALVVPGDGAADPVVAEIQVLPNSIAARPFADCDGVSVSVSDPAGTVIAKRFARGEAAVLAFGANDKPADGVYTYEVALIPPCYRGLGAGHERDVEGLSGSGLIQSGYFRLAGGALVTGAGEPPAPEPVEARAERSAGGTTASEGPRPEPDDVVVDDDQIVKGRICAGAGCVNGEAFDFDTLRLKQLLPSIKFVDTGTGAGARDWQIFINTFFSTVDRFAISDLDSGRTPFTIRGNAPHNALYVDGAGRLGFGTATPAQPVHVSVPREPVLRLHQNGTGGSSFPPYAWDVGLGNTGGFYVRDVTANRFALRIDAGAPDSSVHVKPNGYVGLGTLSPESPLQVDRQDGAAKLLVNETNSAAVARELLELRNTGPVSLRLTNAAAGYSWRAGINGVALGETFFLSHQASPGQALVLEPDGDLTILGALTTNSDRDTKDGIRAVDPQAVLAKLKALPVSTWHRQTDEQQVRHMGPMAQDFAAAFELGADERRIAPLDVAGVALAAIQALEAQVRALEKQNADLTQRLEGLETSLRR